MKSIQFNNVHDVEVVRIHSVYHTLSTQKKTELLIALNKWVADEMSKLPK